MSQDDKRRQARLQGRHNTRLPKTNFVPEKEETSLVHSSCQNKIGNTFINEALSPVVHPEETSCVIDKDQERDLQEIERVNNSERFRDGNNHGRKRSQRYDSNPRQRGAVPSLRRGARKNCYNQSLRNFSISSINETAQCLNTLSVNTDIAVNASTTSIDTHKQDSRRFMPKNDRRRVPQNANNRIHFYSDTNEQNDPQSKHNFSRGRNKNRYMRNRSNFDRTLYSADETTSEEINKSRIHNECRTEIQRPVSLNSYKLNQASSNDSNHDVDEISGDYQRQNVRTSSKFLYEETHQAENIIQKTKGPIPLNITGWHKMIQHNPEDKESFLYFKPDFLAEDEREYCYQYLRESIKWKEKEIIIRGEKYTQPRLVAWYGPLPYSYSNVALEPNYEFPSVILDIKERIENILREEQNNVTFNSVLLNMYRDGKDSVAWHSDDELSMGIHPTIASVSLGETRRFEMKLKQDRRQDGAHQAECEEYVIHLTSGSLLVMDGAMQQYWLHRVPKEYHDRDCRINLTFRTVYPTEEKQQ